MKHLYTVLVLNILLFVNTGLAKDKSIFSVLGQALAPNSGGQIAYALKLLHNDIEYEVFQNKYLKIGSNDFYGSTVSYNYNICDNYCWWRLYTQAGLGLTNAGVIAKISWGSIIPMIPIWLPYDQLSYYPSLRLELLSQFIFIQGRIITWNYPFWVGLSFAF